MYPLSDLTTLANPISKLTNNKFDNGDEWPTFRRPPQDRWETPRDGFTGGVWSSGPGDDADEELDSGVATATVDPELERPPMYKVILLNDDYTPMEFVVHILEAFFSMNREQATQIMLTVHTEGSAVVGIFPRDIAETKSEQVNQYSQENQHPLIATVEMTD